MFTIPVFGCCHIPNGDNGLISKKCSQAQGYTDGKGMCHAQYVVERKVRNEQLRRKPRVRNEICSGDDRPKLDKTRQRQANMEQYEGGLHPEVDGPQLMKKMKIIEVESGFITFSQELSPVNARCCSPHDIAFCDSPSHSMRNSISIYLDFIVEQLYFGICNSVRKSVSLASIDSPVILRCYNMSNLNVRFDYD